jgi:NADPH-dependent curcumin reductase CurA
MINRRIVLAARPQGHAGLEHFRLERTELPPLAPGQVLVRHHYLSLDPYMRTRMDAAKSYAPAVEVGEPMVGRTVGEIVESRHDRYSAGELVADMGGWQEYAVVDATVKGALNRLDTARVPLSAWLGPAGMPGITAWIGLHKFIEPKAGETIVVDAASGAVGSIVGQLVKAAGCRAVGLAGGAAKCAHVREELGFDACIDYKAHRDFASLAAALDAAAPIGVDGCFENVGGLIFDVVLSRMNAFGRIALCGMISGYDQPAAPIANPKLLLTQRLRLQGFIVSEHPELWGRARDELADGIASGRIRYRESIAQGIENAPAAFLGMLAGANFGKQLVKLI